MFFSAFGWVELNEPIAMFLVVIRKPLASAGRCR